jgi:hypothetical protein
MIAVFVEAEALMYFPDLTPYAYAVGGALSSSVSERVLNVGWLER